MDSNTVESSVPLVETAAFLNKEGNWVEDCKKVVKAFEETGCLVIRDPRVNQTHNAEVIDMMEKFFESRSKMYYDNQPVPDIFPQYNYQVGATPELKELPRNHCPIAEKMTGFDKPMSECPPPLDPKWRYFWKIGDRPAQTDDQVDPPQHIPADFPEWEEIMNKWGSLLHEACLTVSRMLAVGFGFEEETFTEKMREAAHLLAPTGSDLSKYNKGTVFASFHYDFNFLSIHGKSRYPGLFIWLKNGTKIGVSMPDGCLLLQAGKQLEHLTGGYIKAGFHEVVFSEKTQAALDKTIANGGIPWRISSTFFSHINKDVTLEPLGQFATEESKTKYPSILTKQQVMEELRAINLAGESKKEEEVQAQ
jgi:isopenicillin N synthase-like dioxygenase